MMSEIPAKLSVEGVGRDSPHCVLRVKQVDVEGIELALLQLTLHLLL